MDVVEVLPRMDALLTELGQLIVKLREPYHTYYDSQRFREVTAEVAQLAGVDPLDFRDRALTLLG